MGDLTKNFDRKEFACKCGCGYDDIDLALVEDLQKYRDFVDRPVLVTSGCRCPYRNHQEGGVASSAHLTGEAVDISCIRSGDRYNAVTFFMDLGYNRFGIGRSFIHVDRSTVNPQNVIWLYN